MTVNHIVELTGVSARTIRRKIKNKELSPYNKQTGKKARYRRDDVLRVVAQTIANKEKFRPDCKTTPPNIELPTIEVVTTKEQVDKAIKADTERFLLNATGDFMLKSAKVYLEEKGLLDSCSDDALYGYAMAWQMREKYLIVADMMEEKMWHDLVKQYGADIKHYEKELGLTPASLAKIKPQEKDDKVIENPFKAMMKEKK